ncbi:MAG: NAD-dependent 4,6-dehydratase LegB [Candidatus Omnitrophica bacterium]|nr:NAD-dependent 4,6-dehydratase LegB [Candidatus Omnitrophota bacterium]
MEKTRKKILITGADGFIGSHLTEFLIERDYDVRAFVYYNSFNSWGWLDSLPDSKIKRIEVFPGDIRDVHGVEKAMKSCDIVFHLAALIAIPFSYQSPDSYADTNIKGTLNILQSARKLDVKKIIITSTSEVYGTAQYVPIDEKHPLQAQSPYSATKIAADRLAESFYRSFKLPIVIARPFNTYGPRQSARAIIPAIITQLLAGAREIRLGNLVPTRDFNYVKDVCRAFLEIAGSKKTIGEEINISSGIEVSVEELAKILVDKLNRRAKIIIDEERKRPKGSEVERLLGSNKKITSLTGWQPKYSLEKGLEETIIWFKKRENLKRYKTGIYNI